MDGSPDHAAHLIIDSVNPGLVSLFTEEFVRQTAISRTQEQAPAEQSKPAVPEKAPEAPAPKEPEQAAPVKHRLTPEEKKIKEAVMDTLKAQIAGRNDGMLATYRSSNQSFKVMMEHNVRIEGNHRYPGWRADVRYPPPPFCQEGARLLSRADTDA